MFTFYRLKSETPTDITSTIPFLVASPPRNLSVICGVDPITGRNYISLSWVPPAEPNGKIWQYRAEITGVATYLNRVAQVDFERWSLLNKTYHDKDHKDLIEGVPPNTNYTVKVRGVTRPLSNGEKAVGRCLMPPAVPDRDEISYSWTKIESEGRRFFKISLPRVTERNGSICCYRIFMIRLEAHKSIADLPPPEEIPVYSYSYVHSTHMTAAYLAEMFDSKHFSPEVFLGDGESNNSSHSCQKCIGLKSRPTNTILKFVPEVLFLFDVTTSS